MKIDEEDVPFDLRHIRFVEYYPNREGMEKLREDIKKSIQSVEDVL